MYESSRAEGALTCGPQAGAMREFTIPGLVGAACDVCGHVYASVNDVRERDVLRLEHHPPPGRDAHTATYRCYVCAYRRTLWRVDPPVSEATGLLGEKSAELSHAVYVGLHGVEVRVAEKLGPVIQTLDRSAFEWRSVATSGNVLIRYELWHTKPKPDQFLGAVEGVFDGCSFIVRSTA